MRACAWPCLITAPQAGHVNDPGQPSGFASELAGRRHKAGYHCCPARKIGRIFQALRHAAGDKGTGMPFAAALAGLQAASGLKAGGRVGWRQKNALRRFWTALRHRWSTPGGCATSETPLPAPCELERLEIVAKGYSTRGKPQLVLWLAPSVA